jgi:ABC-type polysaccharide/polyol phosphate transport system ATPase subunit
LAVEPGGFFGVVGRNGSGKNTLLKIFAAFRAEAQGRPSTDVSPFIARGRFQLRAQRTRNIEINAMLRALTPRQLQERFTAILTFAELERFVDQQLKNYRTRMLSRLAYSIAIQVPFDILVLDEVLAVGDERFQARRSDTFKAMRAEGKTIVLVSHDLSAIQRFSDRARYLANGSVQIVGDPAEVVEEYRRSESATAELAV